MELSVKDPLVVDIETGATDPWNGDLLCLGWAFDTVRPYDKQVFALADCRPGDGVPEPVHEMLADPERPIISHSTFDPRFLKLAEWDMCGPYFDTQVMAHTLDENTPLDLEWLVKHWLGWDMDKRLHRRDKKVWFTTDDGRTLLLTDAWQQVPEQVMRYCQRDAEATLALYHELRKALDRGLWTSYWLEEEVPYTEVLVNMQCAGLPVNLKQASHLRDKLSHELISREKKLLADIGYGFNLGSGDQLAQVLFQEAWWQEDHLLITCRDDFRKPAYNREFADDDNPPDFARWKVDQAVHQVPPGFEVQKVGRDLIHGHWLRKGFGWKATPPTPSGDRPSTSTPDLMVHHADKPLVREIVEHRKLGKVINTYLDTYPKHSRDARLYGRFKQPGTVTGRLSSSEPNLMNQPRRGPLGKEIRSLFQGNLIVGDHSQLEARLAAHYSMDPLLVEIYRQNLDIYVETAERIFGRKVTKEDEERDLCKTLWLGSQYGAYPPKLAATMCLNGFPTTEDEAGDLLAELRNVYSTLFRWREYIIVEARDKGYVKTIGGRYRRLKSAFHHTASWKMQSRGERQAVNAVIQGSAADILRRNMLSISGLEMQWPIELLVQVHDELVMERFDPDDYEPEFWSMVLRELKSIGESPGYELHVPLVFEPVFCRSWAEKDSPGMDVEVADEETHQG